MKIVSLDSVPCEAVTMDGAFNALRQNVLSSKDEVPHFSFRVFTLKENGHTPFHQHPFEHMNYVIQGAGAVVNENEIETEIKKGDFLLIQPNEKHQYRNKSVSEPFVFICAVPKEYE